MQLLKGANKSRITRVCREIRLRRRPNVYHRNGGDSPIPTVAKAVRMDRALPNPFPKLRKGLFKQNNVNASVEMNGKQTKIQLQLNGFCI